MRYVLEDLVVHTNTYVYCVYRFVWHVKCMHAKHNHTHTHAHLRSHSIRALGLSCDRNILDVRMRNAHYTDLKDTCAHTHTHRHRANITSDIFKLKMKFRQQTQQQLQRNAKKEKKPEMIITKTKFLTFLFLNSWNCDTLKRCLSAHHPPVCPYVCLSLCDVAFLSLQHVAVMGISFSYTK